MSNADAAQHVSGHKYTLRCAQCARVYAAGEHSFRCGGCGAPTVVAMNLSPTDARPTGDTSLWRYFDFLPLDDRRWIVSQGEGGTPLVDAPRLATQVDVARLQLKNETLNPTGAFKDVQFTVGMSKAKEAGARAVAVVSSGNVAASAASYAAAEGMTCTIFTPANAPVEKLVQAQMYGADVYRVRTESSSRVMELVMHLCAERGWYSLSTTGLYNPYSVEGAKTIAYELVEQADPLPDWIVVPVGGGGLLGALWRGFTELQQLGRCKDIPRLVGVQPLHCAPLVHAITHDLTPADAVTTRIDAGSTVAGALADDLLFDAYTALPAIRETGGVALGVSDEEILAAEALLARTTGVFAEPAGAAAVAALQQLCAAGTVTAEHTVCCVITGTGFKDLNTAQRLVPQVRELAPDERAFAGLG